MDRIHRIMISYELCFPRYFSEKAIPTMNTSAPPRHHLKPTLVAQMIRWGSLTADMFLERTCLEEGHSAQWEIRPTTDTPLAQVTAAIMTHLKWDDIVILTDGESDGELFRIPLATKSTYVQNSENIKYNVYRIFYRVLIVYSVGFCRHFCIIGSIPLLNV